jgi:hypothetical protein
MSVNYNDVLADLRQVKADAEAGIAAIERLTARAQLPVGASPSVEPMHKAIPEGDASVPQQVARFLGSQPGKSFTIAEIILGTGAQNIPTLRGALGRMVKRGQAGKQGRGRYRAPRPGDRLAHAVDIPAGPGD